jgi:general secretion pathway protein G
MKNLRYTRSGQKQQGFSLAELLVVIVIIGLLATAVVPQLLDRMADAFGGKAKADVTAIAEGVTMYAVNNGGRYPDSLEELITPDMNNSTYLDMTVLPQDPWGHPYAYEPPQGDQKFLVWCYGKDGEQGGEGDDLDFNNQMIKNGEY